MAAAMQSLHSCVTRREEILAEGSSEAVSSTTASTPLAQSLQNPPPSTTGVHR
jgi:hypothetical protein